MLNPPGLSGEPFLDTDEPQTIGDECADNVSDEELQLTFL